MPNVSFVLRFLHCPSPDFSFTGKAKIGSASVAAPAAAPAAGGAKPAAAAAKVEAKPEPEEEADLGFSLFD